MQILLLSAPLKERIWGGEYFKQLGRTSSETIGELWSASAHPQGESTILNGELKGLKLSEVYSLKPELFNNPTTKEFPILVKLIYAKEALSVQVHPNDEYALKNENQYGKTEGWLILNNEQNANLVLGHIAKNKDELIKYIENNNYDELLNYINVEQGQFIPIYAGTIHAIGAGLTILEIQQSSDVTYRFYDYNRKDSNGNERELHIEKAIAVTTYNKQTIDNTNHFTLPGHKIWDNEYFTVSSLNINNSETLTNPTNYSIITVADGNFEIENHPISIGDSFILTKLANNINIKGNGILIRTDAK